MELGKVLPLTAEVKDDHLFIGGCDMVEIAKEFGTALYVFDQADLEARMDEYVQSFKKYYAIVPKLPMLPKRSRTKPLCSLPMSMACAWMFLAVANSPARLLRVFLPSV